MSGRNRTTTKLVISLCLVLAGGVAAVLIITNCKDPIKIGFVGGLTGRVADLGAAGRDGVLLAVEQKNRAGGINSREITLLVRDDKQDPASAVAADRELIGEGVVAIIGHMTSAMSVAAVPVVDQSKVLMISPTTSTNDLTGKEDWFFRVYPASALAAERMARHMRDKRGFAKVTVVYDLANKAYTENLYEHFKSQFESCGGAIQAAEEFDSLAGPRFMALARRMIAGKPDCFLILANAMDTAMICQQLRKLGSEIPIAGGEWSASEELLEYGGKAVEGLFVFHTFDRSYSGKRFVDFKMAFMERFGYRPGFAATHAYDAAQVLFAALERNSDPEDLPDTIRQISTFESLQGKLSFDRAGDVKSRHFLVTIADGRFMAGDGQ